MGFLGVGELDNLCKTLCIAPDIVHIKIAGFNEGADELCLGRSEKQRNEPRNRVLYRNASIILKREKYVKLLVP